MLVRRRSCTGSPTTATSRDAPLPVRLAALRHDAVRPPQPDRDDGDARLPARAARCPTCPRIGSRSCEIVPSGNTATHSPRRSASTAAESAPRRIGGAAVHRDLVRGAQQRAERRLLEQLGLGEEPDPALAPIGDARQRERVEIRDVIAREDHRTVRRGCSPRPRSSSASRTATRARTPPSRRDTPRPRSVAYAANAESIPRRRGDRRPAPVVHAWARRGSPRCSPRPNAKPLARSMAECVVARRRARVRSSIVSSAPEVVAWARDRGFDVVDDPGSLDARRRRGPGVGDRAAAWRATPSCTPISRSRASLDAVVGDGARRDRGDRPRPSRRRHPGALAPDRDAVHVRVRTRFGRPPRRRGRAPVAHRPHRARPGARASTSTSPPTSPRSKRCGTPPTP